MARKPASKQTSPPADSPEPSKRAKRSAVGRKSNLPAQVAPDLNLDTIEEAELPAYRKWLWEAVTAAQQTPAAAGLTPYQIALAFVMTDPRVQPRTVVNWCRIVGCDRSVYYETWRNPRWIAFKATLAKQLTDAAYDDAMAALHRLVKAGNPQALRLFFEIRGDLVHRTENVTRTETPEERMKRLRVVEVLEEQPPGLPGTTTALVGRTGGDPEESTNELQ